MILNRLFHAALLLVLTTVPAHAGPLVGIFTGIIAAVKGSVFLTALFKIAGSVVLSKLAGKFGPKPRQPGIKSEVTATGALNPCSFVLGRYATSGVMVCPPMVSDYPGHLPNDMLTYVVELGDVRGQTLEGIWVDGEWVPNTGTPSGSYGVRIDTGRFANHMWIKYHDGTQIAADPMLMATYAAHPERPWSSDMIGHGICYAVLNFLFDPGYYSALPVCRFVMGGIPLYDPRKDSTVGGVGAHRWATKSTWEQTNNPQVMAYNIHRGIDVAGHVYGGRDGVDDLPLAAWFAAMNACDVTVSGSPQFRAGYEVFVNEEPASVLEELHKASLAEVADMGGRWIVSVADGGLPVYVLDDDSLISTQSGDRSPFPAPQDTWNAIAGNYPEPSLQWEAAAAPVQLDAGWEAEDGDTRRTATMDYPAVPYAIQVQRLMAATIATERRFLTHSEVLPPEAAVLDVLDVVTWNSDLFGYSAKLFQIGRMTEDLQSGLITIHARERDPDDLAIPGGPSYAEPPALSMSGMVPLGPIATFGLGPSAPLTLAPAVIDHLDTGWVTVASYTVPALRGPVVSQHAAAMVTAVLLGAAAAKPMLWRLRLVHAGGTLEVFSRPDWLMPGEDHKITAAAMAETSDAVSDMHIDVSGRGLVSGETIEIDTAHMRVYAHNR